MRHRSRTTELPILRIATLFLAALLTACGGGGGGASGDGGDPPVIPPVDTTPPTVTVTVPAGDQALLPGDDLRVVFTADDDSDAEVRVVLDVDGDPLTTGDQVELYTATDQNGSEVSLTLDTSSVPVGIRFLIVIVDDGVHEIVKDGGSRVLAYPGLAGVDAPRANRYGVTGGQVVFSVGEAEQGAGDLDADGDAGDGVVAIVDTLAGTFQQTQLSIDVAPVGLHPVSQILPSDGDAIFWHRREADEGRVLNGDGDTTDTVVAFTAPLLGVGPTTNPTGGASLTGGVVLGHRMVRYVESLHGFDLNGDGDVLDEVVLALDATLNTLAGAGPQIRPGAPYVSRGQFGIYLFDEATQGFNNVGVDVNGDGVANDTLVAVVDAGTGSTIWTNVNHVVPTGAIDTAPDSPAPPVAGFYVDELLATPGGPLNGDGDVMDFIPTLGTGPELFDTIAPSNGTAGARYVFCSRTTVIHLVSEEGATDRNGDGDTGDVETLHWIDATGAPAWNPLSANLPGRTGLALDGGFGANVSLGWVSLAVTESANGVVMNGDGDQGDTVLFLVDLWGATPIVHNTGIVPADPSTLPLPGATIPITGLGGDSGVLINAAETANGDLNGDGDATDVLLLYFDFTAPTTPIVLADTGALHASIRGGVIATTTYEGLNATDLNGDGDANDFLFRCFDLTGAVIQPGILCDQTSVPASEDGLVWAFLRSEAADQRILNGDADMTDRVLGVWMR